MIAARASSAFVCFRCELHLTRPQLDVFSRRSRAAFSTSVRRRNEDETAHAQRPNLITYVRGQTSKPKRISRVRATTARLGEGVKTLGDDAEILVLKDVAENVALENDSKANTISTPAPEAPDLLASLQDEAKPLTLEDIAKQLDSLRPKTEVDVGGSQYVDQRTYTQLVIKLSTGFTSKQLLHYYSTVKGVERNQAANKAVGKQKEMVQGDFKRPAERSAWHPGTTPIAQRLPSLHSVHRKRAKRHFITKQTLVDQILRDVWKLVLLEEIEAPGELELVLKPWQLTLLQSGSSPKPLDRIGTARKARIETHSSVIRITADKTTARYAADDIEQYLQAIESKRLDLNKWIPYLPDYKESEGIKQFIPESASQTISEMTEAVVQIVPGNVVSITALSKSAVAEAERCILRMLPLNDFSALTLDTSRRDAASVECYLVPARLEDQGFNFQWRDQKLGRWTIPQAPSAHQSDAASNGDSFQGSNALKHQMLNMLDRVAPQSTDYFSDPSGIWLPTTEIQIYAKFGHVLFSQDISQLDSEPKHKAQAFVHTIPGLPKILTDRSFQPMSRLSPPVLSYDFVAAPNQAGFKTGQPFPQIRAQFRFNPDTSKYALRNITLHGNTHVHDVLLPDKAVDMRFTVATAMRMRKKPENEKIVNFIQAILENIDNGSKLEAPNIDLEIPTRMLPGYESNTEGLTTVQYIYTGVQFRQSVSAKYLGVDVAVTTQHGGKLSRKGAALSAFFNTAPMGAKPNPALLRDGTLWHEFINRTTAIADRITMAARDPKPLLSKIGDRPRAREDGEKSTADTKPLAGDDNTPVSDYILSPSDQTLRNIEKRRDPNSARAIRRRALFGNPVVVGAPHSDASSITSHQDEYAGSQPQSEDHGDPNLKGILLNEEASQKSHEEQVPADLTSSNDSGEAIAMRKEDGPIKAPA